MDSQFVSIGLPLALALVMFGLGMSLTVDDFVRVTKAPRIAVIALTCQMFLLPAIAFGLAVAFDLAPLLAVGIMILAASPGGTTANLFSHLFRGDVALNITLTAVNSVLAVVTLPLLANLAIEYFEPSTAGDVGLQFGKTVQVFAIVLIPVGIGMLVRRFAPGFAARTDRAVRILSAVVLAAVVAGAILAERENIRSYFLDVGVVMIAFCIASLAVGYTLPRLLSATEGQAIACCFEIGIHNVTLAIAVAVTVLDSSEMAIPSAVYGVLMLPIAAAFGWLLVSRRRAAQPVAGPRPGN